MNTDRSTYRWMYRWTLKGKTECSHHYSGGIRSISCDRIVSLGTQVYELDTWLAVRSTSLAESVNAMTCYT